MSSVGTSSSLKSDPQMSTISSSVGVLLAFFRGRGSLVILKVSRCFTVSMEGTTPSRLAKLWAEVNDG